jgi:hypothetical protein
MDGVHRTDAGWVRRGTRPVQNGGRVSRWSILSRAERAAWRLGTAAALGGIGYGEWKAPQTTDESLTAAGAAAAVAGGYAAVRGALNWRHRRHWVRPLHLALEGPLGLPDGTWPASYLHIPRDYPERVEVGRIDLPASYVGVGGGQAQIADIVKTKLGLSDASVTFKLAGREPHLVIRQTPRPPAKVLFADAEIRELAEAAKESAPLIGLGPQRRPVSVDLDAESPHVLVSASTGGGKSVITRAMTAKALNKGALATVLDFKRHSHKWARGLPNVDYRRDIAEIHDALVELGEEGHRRNVIVDEWDGDEADAPVGPRHILLVEEANATISKLKRYWSAVRTKEDPKESPAIDALREILFMGRAVKLNVLLVAQSATAAALGGPEVRECFATRILARYTRNAWMMLVPEVQPVPRSTRHVGRAQVVLGGVATETQVVFLTPDEARAWASSGTVASFATAPQDARPAAPEDARPAVTVTRHDDDGESVYLGERPSVSRDVTPHLTLLKGGPDAVDIPPMPTVPPQIPRYSLAAAAREGIVPMTADALRQAKRRDAEFPKDEAGTWTADQLIRWYRNRPTTKPDEESAS